jgi:hypothetical protein
MFNLTRSQQSTCLAVSLWQGTKSLGWFRGKYIYNTGMQITGPVEGLEDNSMVTVIIELKSQEEISIFTVKALVMHSTYCGAELWWAHQHVGAQPLIEDSARQVA